MTIIVNWLLYSLQADFHSTSIPITMHLAIVLNWFFSFFLGSGASVPNGTGSSKRKPP